MPPAFMGLAGIVGIIVGLAVLLAGRRLYWLFVGAAGFLAGFSLAANLLPDASPVLVLIVALAGGLVGALLATFLQRASVFLAGLVAGGMLAIAVLRALGIEGRTVLTIGFVIGALPGAIFSVLLLDWALIVLSAIVGATLVTQSLTLRRQLALVVLAALIVIGLLVQATDFHWQQAPAATEG